jgi:hypothetical protein
MEQSPSWETNSHSSSQEIPHLIQNNKNSHYPDFYQYRMGMILILNAFRSRTITKLTGEYYKNWFYPINLIEYRYKAFRVFSFPRKSDDLSRWDQFFIRDTTANGTLHLNFCERLEVCMRDITRMWSSYIDSVTDTGNSRTNPTQELIQQTPFTNPAPNLPSANTERNEEILRTDKHISYCVLFPEFSLFSSSSKRPKYWNIQTTILPVVFMGVKLGLSP